jgi:5-hydroxyisourate hydrolase
MSVSTHILDASLGAPAAGVAVTLSRQASVWQDLESGVTDPDGRHRFGAETPGGVYRLVFGTGPYFTTRGVAAFYPEVTITFTVPEDAGTASAGHFHVPLLLSPFAYSTYRGS